jgi:hypothetical protein
MYAMVPASWGEVIDKITILEIKNDRLSSTDKLRNVRHELTLLADIRDKSFPDHQQLRELAQQLKAINEKLWLIEDEIRDCERNKDFGGRFTELARQVYKTNDDRSAIKQRINQLLGSELVEEKSYAPY